MSFRLIGGPCLIKNRNLILRIPEEMIGLCSNNGIDYMFKDSFNKDNRSTSETFRGPDGKEGLRS
jgi:2-dehydro-3-deoxyphosphooctonate aldolase (KDO 8-P synthase)